MLCEQLQSNVHFKVQAKAGTYFSLHNVALDLNSQEAALFLILENKEILIVEMSRSSTGVKSSNINLDFEAECDVVLVSKGGSVHIIGAFRHKPTATPPATPPASPRKKDESTEITVTKQAEDKAKQSQVDTSREEEKPITLRRSSRARVVAPVEQNNKSIKRQKQALKNMANYFDCGDNLDDDEDSYSEKNEQSSSSSSQDSSKMDEQFSEDFRMGRKKKTIGMKDKKMEQETQQNRKASSKQSASFGNFSVPTKNPYQ